MSFRARATRIIFLMAPLVLTPNGFGASKKKSQRQSDRAPAQVNSVTAEAENHLPTGIYPHIRDYRREARDNRGLEKEVKDLTLRVRDTVKDIAAHRNTRCFGDPCLFQVFPIVYNVLNSGFFGGARAKITNVSRVNPYLYSLESYLIRSDTRQWLTYLAGDFPEMRFLPLDPRLKFRTTYTRSSERRYFGSGATFETSFDPDFRYRYALEEYGLLTTLSVPIVRWEDQKLNIFGSYSFTRHRPQPFSENSKLFEDQPEGIAGGKSARFALGLQLDARDREILSRKGWAIEVSGEISRPPVSNFDFRRLSLVDRRYFSLKSFTLAHRLTLDGIWGRPPFWELEGVGGFDPIPDVANSTIQRGYYSGRFHERFKIIENLETRYHFPQTRILGLLTEVILIPLAVDLGSFGNITSTSLVVGSKFYFNKNLLVQFYITHSGLGYDYFLDFGQDF